MKTGLGSGGSVWIGLLLSALLHATVAAIVLSAGPPPTPAEETVVNLDLTMFGDSGTESATIADRPSPVRPLPASDTAAAPPPPPLPKQVATPPAKARRLEERKPSAKPSTPLPLKQRLSERERKPTRQHKPRRSSERERKTPSAALPKSALDRLGPGEKPSLQTSEAGRNHSGIRRAPPAKTAGPPPPAADRASGRDYANALQRAIAKRQHYPASARRNRETGVATVAFSVHADGRLGDIRIASSSGHSALDQAALDAIRRLGRFKPIPRSIGRQVWPMRVPIRFDLR